MGFSQEIEHWFSFRDSCISVVESVSSLPSSNSKHSIFFLHGRFGQGEMWTPIMDGLSSHFRCIALDFPGFGRSFSARDRAFTLLEHASLVNELIHKFT